MYVIVFLSLVVYASLAFVLWWLRDLLLYLVQTIIFIYIPFEKTIMAIYWISHICDKCLYTFIAAIAIALQLCSNEVQTYAIYDVFITAQFGVTLLAFVLLACARQT